MKARDCLRDIEYDLSVSLCRAREVMLTISRPWGEHNTMTWMPVLTREDVEKLREALDNAFGWAEKMDEKEGKD